MFLEILKNSHLCHSLSFNKDAGLRLANLLKKRLCHRCFPVNFCENFENTVFTEQLRVTATEYYCHHTVKNFLNIVLPFLMTYDLFLKLILPTISQNL